MRISWAPTGTYLPFSAAISSSWMPRMRSPPSSIFEKNATPRGSAVVVHADAHQRVVERGVELPSEPRLLDGAPPVEQRLEPALLDDRQPAAQAVRPAEREPHVAVLRVLLEPGLALGEGRVHVLLELLLLLRVGLLGRVDELGPRHDRLAVVAVGMLGVELDRFLELRLGAVEVHRVDAADAF